MTHREHYKPEPMQSEPHPLLVIGGAIVFAAAVYLLVFIVFII
jgi:hypothetical protein